MGGGAEDIWKNDKGGHLIPGPTKKQLHRACNCGHRRHQHTSLNKWNQYKGACEIEDCKCQGFRIGVKPKVSKAKPKKLIVKQGKRGKANVAARLKARKDYFKTYGHEAGEIKIAYCQLCRGIMRWDQADACHKLDASLCGPETPENYLIGHGIRSGPGNCNDFMEQGLEIKQAARAATVNAKTGGYVKWPEHLEVKLREFQRKHGVSWVPRHQQ